MARDKTFHPGQIDASETLFQVPHGAMHGQRTFSGAWPGVEKIDLGVFRPAHVAHLYVRGVAPTWTARAPMRCCARRR